MNLWILTEEKPKKSVVLQILNIYLNDFENSDDLLENSNLKIIPIIESGIFKFKYFVDEIELNGIQNIYIKTVSGPSSFVDFLFFKQHDEPNDSDDRLNNLLFAVEETKTSDLESRNTGIYQRGSKFVYIQAYYSVPLYMLYNDEIPVDDSIRPSATNVFGTNMLLTLGVKIVGKNTDPWFSPFTSLDEFIEHRSQMRRPPASNVPILITKVNSDLIQVSGRLSKPANAGNIGHDPNIGALSLIAATIRKLGWEREIQITMHGVSQEYIDRAGGNNKFVYIANLLNVTLEGIELPVNTELPDRYWYYEKRSEKIASILFHILTENMGFNEVYHNHAGSERGYFKGLDQVPIVLPKRTPEDEMLRIPDIIMADVNNNIIYLMEGKQLTTINDGLEELNNFDDLARLYINTLFPNYKVIRGLTIFGGNLTSIPDDKVLLYLAYNGNLIINF